MNTRIIVVDIGNTSIALAVAEGERIGPVHRLPTHAKTDAHTLRATLNRAVGRRPAAGAALCSVVPRLNARWLDALRRATGCAPLLIHHRLRLGVGIDYPHPGSIGADRLANASGAVARYGAPVVVADFGTALTFDVISRAGAYIGGVIAPGLPLMTEYLAERTALLPHLDLRRAAAGGSPPACLPAIGKSTLEAMLSGARWGYLGMVREILARVRRELGERRVRLCATGGYAAWALAGARLPVRIAPDLTLFGIRRIFDLNRGATRHALDSS